MTDQTGKPPEAAPDAAPEAELTEEQLWNAFAAEDSASADAPEPEDAPAAPEDKDDDAPPEGWDEADDAAGDDQTPSEDTDQKDETADDPWAKAPPELLKEREKMEHTIRSLNGRVRALTKRHQAALKSPTKDETDALAATKKVLAEKADEYPDILGPVVETIERLETKIARFDEASAQDRDALLAEEWGTFTSIHSDGMDVVNKNAQTFATWLKDQPEDVRNVIEANKDAIVDGQAAAEVVSLFKQHLEAAQKPPAPEPNTTPDPRRASQLRGAQSTSSRSPRVTADPTIGEMTDEQYWAYLERQERAQAKR